MNLVADTNVVSFVFKRDARALPYRQTIGNQQVGISFATVAELYRWALSRGWGQRRIGELRTEIARYIVLPSDDRTAWEWARVTSIKGRPVTSEDAWIAATALRHNVPLVTHNPRHFEHIAGLNLISHAS